MRLPDFILHNLEPILQAWEDFARTIQTPGADLDREGLRDHAEQMLRAIVLDLRTTQTAQEQIDKAQGLAPQHDDDTRRHPFGSIASRRTKLRGVFQRCHGRQNGQLPRRGHCRGGC